MELGAEWACKTVWKQAVPPVCPLPYLLLLLSEVLNLCVSMLSGRQKSRDGSSKTWGVPACDSQEQGAEVGRLYNRQVESGHAGCDSGCWLSLLFNNASVVKGTGYIKLFTERFAGLGEVLNNRSCFSLMKNSHKIWQPALKFIHKIINVCNNVRNWIITLEILFFANQARH